METLKDIRSLEEIPDISLYLFIALGVFALLLLFGLFIMIKRWLGAKSKDLTRKEVLQRLEEMDFTEPKKAAYDITKYARYVADSERSKKIFDALETKLERYKYTPNPPKFSQEDKAELALFLEVVDG